MLQDHRRSSVVESTFTLATLELRSQEIVHSKGIAAAERFPYGLQVYLRSNLESDLIIKLLTV